MMPAGVHKIVGDCIHCKRPMRSDYARKKGVTVPGATAVHAGRGVCHTCNARIRRHGSPEFKPLAERRPADRRRRPGTEQVPSRYLLEDWEILRAEGLTWKQAAPRIGVSEAAMSQALRRARKRGDPRGNLFFHESRSDAA